MVVDIVLLSNWAKIFIFHCEKCTANIEICWKIVQNSIQKGTFYHTGIKALQLQIELLFRKFENVKGLIVNLECLQIEMHLFFKEMSRELCITFCFTFCILMKVITKLYSQKHKNIFLCFILLGIGLFRCDE